MTLVIANRIDKEISFSADSRISFGSSGYFDKGIKIFNVPFKLKGPAKSREDFGKYEFEYNYGLAVIGSSINAYTVKDSIVEVLPNITYLTNLSDFSIPSIGGLVYKAYKEISEELTKTLQKVGLCEILLGGFCLKQRKVRVLRFYPEILEDRVEYHFEEILLNNGMMFFGSGMNKAKKIYEEDKSLNPLQIVKKIIDCDSEKSVGGNIQCGTFYKGNFKISGVVEKVIDKEGNLIETNKYRRGFKIENEMADSLKPPYLFISYAYKPYEIVKETKDKEQLPSTKYKNNKG